MYGVLRRCCFLAKLEDSFKGIAIVSGTFISVPLISKLSIKMGGETKIKETSSSLPKISAGPVGQQIHDIYKGRLGTFQDGGQYGSENLQS